MRLLLIFSPPELLASLTPNWKAPKSMECQVQLSTDKATLQRPSIAWSCGQVIIVRFGRDLLATMIFPRKDLLATIILPKKTSSRVNELLHHTITKSLCKKRRARLRVETCRWTTKSDLDLRSIQLPPASKCHTYVIIAAEIERSQDAETDDVLRLAWTSLTLVTQL